MATDGKGRTAALLALSLGYFMVILDATVVNIALPRIAVDLRASLPALQWIVDAYTLVLAAFLLVGGAIGDRLGNRRVLTVGLALFTIASGLCALAPGVEELIPLRALQGLAAAAVIPTSLGMIRITFQNPAARARALGIWGGLAGVAAASGPVVGGALVSIATWRSVFAINIPIGLLAVVLVRRHLPHSGGHRRRFDLLGQATGTIGLGLLTFALIEAGPHGWTSPSVLASLLMAVAAMASFVALERGSHEPLLPLGLFSKTDFTAGNTVGFLINLGFYGELFALSLYFQRVRDLSALATGVALLPLLGVVAVSSLAAGRFTARFGSRPTMRIGLLCGAIGFGLLAMARPATPYLLLVPPLAAAGFGMAFTMPAATIAVVDSVPQSQAGLAGGVINAFRQVGGAIGVALLGTLLGSSSGGLSSEGFQFAALAAGSAFLLGIAPLSVPRRSGEDRRANHG